MKLEAEETLIDEDPPADEAEDAAIPVGTTLAQAKRLFVEAAARAHSGSVVELAAKLGVSRRALYTWKKKWNLRIGSCRRAHQGETK